MSKIYPLLCLMAALFFDTVAAHATSLADVMQSAPRHGAQMPFVSDGYQGRVSREAFAQNPRTYLRHENAYQALKRGFEVVTGQSFTDRQFNRLLAGRKVRTSQCDDRIMTTGIDTAGNISWFVRDCHPLENLVQVRVGNYWVTVVSDWCWNLVNSKLIAPAPAPIVMTGDTFTPEPPVAPPGCTGAGCTPPPPPPPGCTTCPQPEPPVVPTGQNPGNGKPVGKSPYDGITGRSGQNDAHAGSPPSGSMNGQRDDRGTQPGGGNGPSNTGNGGGNSNAGGNGNGNAGGNGQGNGNGLSH